MPFLALYDICHMTKNVINYTNRGIKKPPIDWTSDSSDLEQEENINKNLKTKMPFCVKSFVK